MRFVDVEDNCIRAVTPQPDYVALSYMWGGVAMFRLTKANLRSMETAGSLLSVTLPRTIQDAIGVTRTLGERYTWIDAVCICQDDEDSYMDQVRHMNKIYCNAALTIVAAGADHADAGLPCFRPGSRRHMQVVEEIQGMRFVSAAPELVEVMDRFSYSSRGWTFQEYVFSKRLLVFTPFQVYYSCEAECISEDFKGPRAPREYIEGFELLEGSAQGAGRNFPTHYETVVATYSRRELTFQADVYSEDGHLAFAEEGILCFATDSAVLLVENRAVNQSPDSAVFRIYHRGKCIGCVLLDREVAESLLGARVLPAKWDEYIDAVQDGGVDDGVHEPAYNVMLIERRDGMAYRVGLGQVLKAGWDLAGPVRKEIELG
ncbi:hypothetical protein H2199_003924 [Coniosporium tulheliwenetii]|uniref:Uncharacterized protein n=1 Tax=Coniosporium tulheliwenetii TaxID=3383036 RepID=A0ACC2Z8R8_9PEZI|nr:hypothetical protein H2199_003924 [Cladosporium sp. JES 115]